jgi:hypothetical protein
MGIKNEKQNYNGDKNRIRNEIIKIMKIENKEQNYKGNGNREQGMKL